MAASKAKQVFWMVVGYGLLIPFCLLKDWKICTSTINPFGRPPRQITEWKWAWLNTIYGNYEDGVSGEEALVWDWPTSNDRVPYRPHTWAPLRAWLWSAWRNSTNQLSRSK
jgi:hypothetical protein